MHGFMLKSQSESPDLLELWGGMGQAEMDAAGVHSQSKYAFIVMA